MPLDVLDFFGGILDLLELLLHWRFWVCMIPAIVVAFLLHEQIRNFEVRWLAIFAVLLVGFVGGLVCDLRRSCRPES